MRSTRLCRVKVFKPKQGRLVWVSMRSTGIGPVSTPWKGAILPLNYKRFLVERFSPLSS